jgi:hypothetical protein
MRSLRLSTSVLAFTALSFVHDPALLLERRALTVRVHLAGMSLVRTLSDGFAWLDNNLPDSAQFREAAVRAFRKFGDVSCASCPVRARSAACSVMPTTYVVVLKRVALDTVG